MTKREGVSGITPLNFGDGVEGVKEVVKESDSEKKNIRGMRLQAEETKLETTEEIRVEREEISSMEKRSEQKQKSPVRCKFLWQKMECYVQWVWIDGGKRGNGS